MFIGISCALFSHGADKLLLYASISSKVTPVKASAVAPTALPVPTNVTYAPNNLLRPICLNCGFEEVASFIPIDTMFVVVLIISAGNDTKLPNGSFLIACINSGTLLYVGYVFLIYHAAASSTASSNVFLAPVNVLTGSNSLPIISLVHLAISLVLLNVPLNCDFTYS